MPTFRLIVDVHVSNPDPNGPDSYEPTRKDAEDALLVAVNCIVHDGYEGPVCLDGATILPESYPGYKALDAGSKPL